jgi:hypothetical protein
MCIYLHYYTYLGPRRANPKIPGAQPVHTHFPPTQFLHREMSMFAAPEWVLCSCCYPASLHLATPIIAIAPTSLTVRCLPGCGHRFTREELARAFHAFFCPAWSSPAASVLCPGCEIRRECPTICPTSSRSPPLFVANLIDAGYRAMQVRRHPLGRSAPTGALQHPPGPSIACTIDPWHTSLVQRAAPHSRLAHNKTRIRHFYAD